jgi:hypothetical protein
MFRLLVRFYELEVEVLEFLWVMLLHCGVVRLKLKGAFWSDFFVEVDCEEEHYLISLEVLLCAV